MFSSKLVANSHYVNKNNYILKLGEVSEWLMVPLSKSGLRASGAWVRIPPSPPNNELNYWQI